MNKSPKPKPLTTDAQGYALFPDQDLTFNVQKVFLKREKELKARTPEVVWDGTKNQYGFPYNYNDHRMMCNKFVTKMLTKWKTWGYTTRSDCMQEAMLVAYKAWRTFDGSKGSVFSAYLWMQLNYGVTMKFMQQEVHKPKMLMENCNAYEFNVVPPTVHELGQSDGGGDGGGAGGAFGHPTFYCSAYITHPQEARAMRLLSNRKEGYFEYGDLFWKIIKSFPPKARRIFLAYYEGRFRTEEEEIAFRTPQELSSQFSVDISEVHTIIATYTRKFQTKWKAALVKVGISDTRTKDDWEPPMLPKEQKLRLWFKLAAEIKRLEEEAGATIFAEYEAEKKKNKELSVIITPKQPAYHRVAKPVEAQGKAHRRINEQPYS